MDNTGEGGVVQMDNSMEEYRTATYVRLHYIHIFRSVTVTTKIWSVYIGGSI